MPEVTLLDQVGRERDQARVEAANHKARRHELARCLTGETNRKADVERQLTKTAQERDECLNALLDVVNQSCQVDYRDGQCAVHHGGVGAYEDAIGLLVTLGCALLTPDGNWVLVWPKDRVARALEANSER